MNEKKDCCFTEKISPVLGEAGDGERQEDVVHEYREETSVNVIVYGQTTYLKTESECLEFMKVVSL